MSSGLRQYRFADVTVQPDAFHVEKSGQSLALEPKSIRLLVYLIEHRSRAIGKAELIHEIWADAAVTDNALTRVVAQLRKALGDNARVARYIETIPTLGYRFISEVTVVAAEPESGVPTRAAVIGPAHLAVWNRTRAKTLGAAILALVAVIAAVRWERWRSAEPPAWSGTPLGTSVNASYPRIAPDGQMLAFRAIIDGEWQLAVMKPDTANWTVLTHGRNRGAVASLAWARDGCRIYFERRFGSGTIYAISPLGGEPQLLVDNALAPEPLPDRSLLVLRPSGDGLQLFRFWPDSGRLEPLPAWTTMSGYRSVRAFPDGKEVAVLGFYGSPAGVRRLFAMDLASHRMRDLTAPEQIAAGSGDLQVTIALSADGETVFTLWKRDNSLSLIGLPRDGSGRSRTFFSYPPGANLLPCDGAPDGSVYMEQPTRQSSVLNLEPAGNTVSQTPLPPGTAGVLPLPGGGFVFTVKNAGRSQLLAATPGAEPRPLLNTIESARLPGAWLGNGRLAFLIGESDQLRLAIGSVESGQVLHRFPFDARHVTGVAASPDGRTLYYTSAGELWEQAVGRGDRRKICEGRDVAADPSGKVLYLTRHSTHGYELFRIPATGGKAEKLPLPSGYSLTPNRLSPAAVNRDGRILLSIQKLGLTFFQAGIYDPVRQTLIVVPAPYQAVVNSAGWAANSSIELQITHWSSTLWRYRQVPKKRPSW
jgi:DNA-binding winged helix-turn-helix (wHTH) protein